MPVAPLKRRGAVLWLGWAVTAATAVTALAMLPSAATASTTSAADGWAQLGDGAVLLYRHAIAPGVGDPPAFKLGDCATQRNLDDSGRAQARRIGQLLRERGVKVAAVWTSQWCRTRETAALAFPAVSATEQPAFNSFFQDRGNAAAQTQAASALLRGWRGPGVLVVVTHQVNITALSGVTPASGAGVVLRWRDAGWQVAGQLPPP